MAEGQDGGGDGGAGRSCSSRPTEAARLPAACVFSFFYFFLNCVGVTLVLSVRTETEPKEPKPKCVGSGIGKEPNAQGESHGRIWRQARSAGWGWLAGAVFS